MHQRLLILLGNFSETTESIIFKFSSLNVEEDTQLITLKSDKVEGLFSASMAWHVYSAKYGIHYVGYSVFPEKDPTLY